MELSQEGAGAEPELLDENYCKMSKMSAEADQDDGEEDEQDDEAEDEEEETLCYTFSADLLASGDIVDVTSNCVDMQGLSEAAVELMRPATILRKQPNNSQSLNLPSVVIHSASNTPKKKKRNTSTSSSQNQTKNNNNSDNKPNGGGGGIPKRSKSFHISSQKKRKISFENNFRTKKIFALHMHIYCKNSVRDFRVAMLVKDMFGILVFLGCLKYLLKTHLLKLKLNLLLWSYKIL